MLNWPSSRMRRPREAATSVLAYMELPRTEMPRVAFGFVEE